MDRLRILARPRLYINVGDLDKYFNLLQTKWQTHHHLLMVAIKKSRNFPYRLEIIIFIAISIDNKNSIILLLFPVKVFKQHHISTGNGEWDSKQKKIYKIPLNIVENKKSKTEKVKS